MKCVLDVSPIIRVHCAKLTIFLCADCRIIANHEGQEADSQTGTGLSVARLVARDRARDANSALDIPHEPHRYLTLDCGGLSSAPQAQTRTAQPTLMACGFGWSRQQGCVR